MPNAVVPDVGLRAALTALLAPRTFARLYRNNLPVVQGSRLSDYQAAQFPGYADIELTDLWSGVNLDPVGRAFSAVYNLEWTRAAGGVPEYEYGWLVYYGPDPGGVLLAGALFATPYYLVNPGQTVSLSVITYLLRG
jgi:hypothetical protein